MSEALPQLSDDVSIARADLSARRVILTPPICTMGEDAHLTQYDVLATLGNGHHLMMGDDPRLPKMPAQPRLVDLFRHRFVPKVANQRKLGEKDRAGREGHHGMSVSIDDFEDVIGRHSRQPKEVSGLTIPRLPICGAR